MTASKYLMIHFVSGLLIFPCCFERSIGDKPHLLSGRSFRLLQSVPTSSKNVAGLEACCCALTSETRPTSGLRFVKPFFNATLST